MMDNIQALNHTSTIENAKDPKVWQAAQALESNFIAEMLKSAGIGKPPENFGGGVGEDQFSSFLTSEYADATVRAGGIGLAESIYQSIVSGKDDSK